MVVLEAIHPVFLEGRIIEPGGKFSCPRSFAMKLVENQSAKLPADNNDKVDIQEEPQPKKTKRKSKNEV